MQQKHTFDAKAFRKQRLPFLLFAMIPSFLLDGYLIFALATHLQSLFVSSDINTFWDAAAPFAANFMLLKAPVVFAYFKFRMQRRGSYILADDTQAVYRKSKMSLFAKLDHGYIHHDDFDFKNLSVVRRKKNGAMVVCGDISVVRKLHGIEAVSRQWKRNRMVVPAYYTDMESITHKLESIAENNGRL